MAHTWFINPLTHFFLKVAYEVEVVHSIFLGRTRDISSIILENSGIFELKNLLKLPDYKPRHRQKHKNIYDDTKLFLIVCFNERTYVVGLSVKKKILWNVSNKWQRSRQHLWPPLENNTINGCTPYTKAHKVP